MLPWPSTLTSLDQAFRDGLPIVELCMFTHFMPCLSNCSRYYYNSFLPYIVKNILGALEIQHSGAVVTTVTS